ncbi:MAG: hypothetical protein ACRD6W_10150, partial [Nitrososphaerales archaeon]
YVSVRERGRLVAMTPVPPPASPCVRVRLIYQNSDGSEAGNRFYLKYAGDAPTAANCVTLATDISNFWASDLASYVSTYWTLTEVDVLDIATSDGLAGGYVHDQAGTDTGGECQAPTCVNIEYDIARRYRGGKPRIFLPPPNVDRLANAYQWTTDTVGAIQTNFESFFSDVTGDSVGSMGTLSHVNLSYYQGFTNVTNSSGRTRAVPTYRAAAKVDAITGYAVKQIIGSQRRRRTATTA